jgi:hypothetical protein
MSYLTLRELKAAVSISPSSAAKRPVTHEDMIDIAAYQASCKL